MKGMKPEDLQRMQQMAGSMGAGGPGGATGGGSTAPDLSAMLRNPEMMQKSMQMMRSMNVDDLARMLQSSRPGMDEAQARQCATPLHMSGLHGQFYRSVFCSELRVTLLQTFPHCSAVRCGSGVVRQVLEDVGVQHAPQRRHARAGWRSPCKRSTPSRVRSRC